MLGLDRGFVCFRGRYVGSLCERKLARSLEQAGHLLVFDSVHLLFVVLLKNSFCMRVGDRNLAASFSQPLVRLGAHWTRGGPVGDIRTSRVKKTDLLAVDWSGSEATLLRRIVTTLRRTFQSACHSCHSRRIFQSFSSDIPIELRTLRESFSS